MTAPILLTLAIVLGSSIVGGLVARAAKQPAVIGEMLAVIALGPALLGWLVPAMENILFPVTSRPVLSTLAQFGVTAFMFIVGMDFHGKHAARRSVLAITLGSLATPFALGMLAACTFPEGRGHTALWVFVLFIGAAMSVTAVPVLALILQDQGLTRTLEARTALFAAAASDVFAWSLLVLIAMSMPGPSLSERLTALIGLGVWILLVRAALTLTERHGLLGRAPPSLLVSASLVAVFVSAASSDAAGLHTIIGPMLLGSALSHQHGLRDLLNGTLGQVVRAALLPFFYLTVGLSLDVSTLTTPKVTVTLLLAAVIGKIGGTLLSAHLTGSPWIAAWRLGILLNTRGLTELVFLTTGLQLTIIQPSLYTSLVLITLFTTVITAPLLSLVNQHFGVPSNVS